MLTQVLERCIGGADFDAKRFSKYESSSLSWCIPVFQSVSLMSDGRTSPQHLEVHERSEFSM